MNIVSAIVTSFTVILMSAFLSPAQAGNLSAAKAKSFVDTLPQINEMAKDMRESGKSDVMKTKMQPVAGKPFQPYTQAVSALKTEFPEDYKELTKVVKGNGFDSAEAWGETGNDVMLSYMALQSNIPANAQMPEISPEMLAKMPPEAQENMMRSMAVMETMKNVPQQNKDIVKPLMPTIETYLASAAPAGESQ